MCWTWAFDDLNTARIRAVNPATTTLRNRGLPVAKLESVTERYKSDEADGKQRRLTKKWVDRINPETKNRRVLCAAA
jgi:hypothetical protein